MLWNQAQWNLALLHLNMKDIIQFSCEGLVDRFSQGGGEKSNSKMLSIFLLSITL